MAEGGGRVPPQNVDAEESVLGAILLDNAAIAAVYLSGGNTRRIRNALAPLLKAAPLSKSAVSRIVATLRSELDAWQQRPLDQVELAYLYLDAIALRVRMGQRVVSVPVLVALGVLADGSRLLASLTNATKRPSPEMRAAVELPLPAVTPSAAALIRRSVSRRTIRSRSVSLLRPAPSARS